MWEVTRLPCDYQAKIERLLREGWEPFAVSVDAANTTYYHFRRFIQKGE